MIVVWWNKGEKGKEKKKRKKRQPQKPARNGQTREVGRKRREGGRSEKEKDDEGVKRALHNRDGKLIRMVYDMCCAAEYST